MKYIFGPVNSRRLGISLGIDLIPYKTCSFDCIYCECGRTTKITDKISDYVDIEEVIEELDAFLKNNPKLDVITFAGSGEPMLHSGIEKVISFLKNNYPQYKICVLTNGSLLYIGERRKAILNADIIIPSLDAASEEIFNKINRPLKNISAGKIIDGLSALRKEFKRTIILEIFIVPGLNDNDKELSLLKAACEKINPDIIQLNSLDRPGSEKWIKKSTREKLKEIQDYLKPCKIEIIENPYDRTNESNNKIIDISNAIIATLSRRPSTIEDLAGALGIEKRKIRKTIHQLLASGEIREEIISRGTFYKVKI